MTDTAASGKRSIPKSSIILLCLFIVYLALTFIGAAHHEIWYDEAQAWNIARGNDIPGIVAQMQYEGHPPLWHFLLHIFTSMGCSVDVMPFISWVITAVTAGLMLWKSPFEPALKGILLFSGGFLFYWSVNSRSYCLIPLLLVLIAMVYKKRSEKPLLYGLLVALLANTHMMMCGLVGILGIFMIIDLFSLWKSSTRRQNILRIAGLLIAGAGVIALVLPLLMSFQSVNLGNDMELTFGNIMSRLTFSLSNIVQSALMDSNDALLPTALKYIIDMVFSIVMILVLLCLRRHKRSLIIHLVFALFYIIVCEVLWFSLPPRGLVFLFMFAFVYWLAKEEPSPVQDEKPSHRHVQLPERLKALEKKADKCCCVLLCVLSAASIPMGSFILLQDYTKDYSQSKKCAEFIRDNISTDAVFITTNDQFPQYSAYLPEYTFYFLGTNEFMNYTSHTMEEPISLSSPYCEKAYEDLKNYDELYLLDFSIIQCYDFEILYNGSGSLIGSTNRSDENVTIYRITADDLLKYTDKQ